MRAAGTPYKGNTEVMAELHFFPMYAAEWLAGEATTLMTPEQESAFLRLLLHSWLSTGVPCSIPEDDRALAELSRLGKRWLKVGEYVRDQFEPVDDYPGRLRNAKLWKVYVAQMEKHSKRVIAGALGGTAKAKGKQRSSIAKALLKQKASTPANPMLYQSESESELESEAEKTTTTKPSKSGDLGSWVGEGVKWWTETVGEIKHARFGAALKSSVTTHGWPAVFPALQCYVEEAASKGKPPKPEWFAGEIVRWLEWASMPATDHNGNLTPRGRAIMGAA
jgi:hypothetical protein